MKKYIKALLATIFVVFILSTNIYADENEVKITKVPYSKEYEEWLNLPEDIRKNSIAPAMYDVDESVIENLRKNSSNTNTRSLLRNSALPSYYNTLDEMEIKVKNQQSRNICWAFAFTSAAEIACKKYENETYEFSPLHIDYGTITRFKDRTNPYAQLREYNTGGNLNNLQAYLSSGQGPILEEYMPYDTNKGEIDYSDMPKKLPSKFIDLQKLPGISADEKEKICSGIKEYSDTDLLLRENIKRKLAESGSLWCTIVMTSYFQKNNDVVVMFNDKKYKYDGADNKSHAVVLVGYDDNYSADNFENYNIPKPKHDGAYIALNSWGNDWGNNGIFYISYDDVNVEGWLGYIKTSSDLDYDNIYQYNNGNSFDFIEFNSLDASSYRNELYTANIFKKDEAVQEELTKIYIPNSSYFKVQNVDLEVYVNPQNSSLNMDDLIKVECNVTNLNQGEEYISLNQPISLTGQSYAVVIKYTVKERVSSVALARERDNLKKYSDVELMQKGQSLFSLDGDTWTDVYDYFEFNWTELVDPDFDVTPEFIESIRPHYGLVLKAITNRIDKEINIVDIKSQLFNTFYYEIQNEISAYVTTTANLNGEKLNVKILKDNTDVTDRFDIVSLPDVKSRASDIKLKNKGILNAGTYVFQVYTQDGLTTEKEFVVTDSLENSEDVVKFEYEDENFLNELYNKLDNFKENSVVSLSDNQIYVKKDYAESVEYLGISPDNKNKKITNIKGIEIFKNLTSLSIENAHLLNIDKIYELSQLGALYINNSLLEVNEINLKNMSSMYDLYLVNCELNDDVNITVRDGLTAICLDKNHLSKISKELYQSVNLYFSAADQTITDEMEFEQNDSYVLIDLPEILKTAPASYLTFENCEYDEASGKIRIYTTNLGQGEAIIEMPKVDDDYIVADPYYSFGSKYTVKYNVVEKKNIDDTDNNEDNEDENIDEPGNVIEKQEDKKDSSIDDINPKTGNNVVTISSLTLLSSLIFVISLKLKKENNDNV